MQYKMLVVDDEPGVVSLLKDYFEMNTYYVLTATDGPSAMKEAEKQPDIILLDINMPKMDGLEVCKKIRDFVSCPIIFLTARIEDIDKIKGFASGGDDYVTKPFSVEELGARVSAHLRREVRKNQSKIVKFEDDLVIDYSSRVVFSKGEKIPLAKKEFEIVELLSMNIGQVFDKERIYERLWGFDSEGNSSVVAEHIKRIRAKLAVSGLQSHLETVWGVGYKWVR